MSSDPTFDIPEPEDYAAPLALLDRDDMHRVRIRAALRRIPPEALLREIVTSWLDSPSGDLGAAMALGEEQGRVIQVEFAAAEETG